MEAVINKPKEKVKLKFEFCHRMPERSFFYKGKQFPVCARCTGFYFGYFTLPIFTFGLWDPAFLWIGLLMLPALVDGLTQAYMNRESNNWLRLATGIPAGAGCMALAALFGQWIGRLILMIVR